MQSFEVPTQSLEASEALNNYSSSLMAIQGLEETSNADISMQLLNRQEKRIIFKKTRKTGKKAGQ